MSYYPSHHALQYLQSFSSDVEQGEFSIPPAPINFLNWDSDDSFLTSSTQAPSATLPSLSAVSPLSYLDVVANSSRTLPVAAPVPVPHAALTKAALRTMMSFDDKGSIYRIPLTKKLKRYLQETHNNSAGGSERLKINDARTRVAFDSDNYALYPNAMNYNALVNYGNSKQTTTGRSKLVIRPISPSTLIALTEPCLMAWCTALDESLDEPGSSAYLPLQSSDYDNYVDTNKAVYNVWGY